MSASAMQLLAALGGAAGTPVYQFWRVLFADSQGTTTFVSIAEIEMRTSLGGANVMSGGTLSASSQFSGSGSDGPTANALDGNASTWWSNSFNQFPAFLKYDFGAGNEKAIVQLLLKVRNDGAHDDPLNFKLQRSSDNSTWVDVLTPAAQSAWSSAESRTFS